METGALETLKHRSTLPCLAPAWVLAPTGALVQQHFSPSLVTCVEWMWGWGNGGAGLRGVTVLLHCSVFPAAAPGLFTGWYW